MGGWVDGHFDIFDILLKLPQPFTGLFFPFFVMADTNVLTLRKLE